MVSPPHPLEVKLDVVDPPPGRGHVYRLGETISLVVRVRPLRDVEVREGRMELVFAGSSNLRDELMTEAMSTPAPLHSSGTAQGQGDTHVHSTVTFLTDSRLRAGSTARYSVRLRVDPEPPPRAAEGTLEWRLVATVEVPGTHDVSIGRTVNIALR